MSAFIVVDSNLNLCYDFHNSFFSSRGVRNDASLVPPIRQTASIFKQPVTIYKTQEGKVKDIKHGNQEKPKQVSARDFTLFCIELFRYQDMFLLIFSIVVIPKLN